MNEYKTATDACGNIFHIPHEQATAMLLSTWSLFWQLHFRNGVIGDSKITEDAEEIIRELDQLTEDVKEQMASLEACLAQLDQYQQVG
jgi:nesprin-1